MGILYGMKVSFLVLVMFTLCQTRRIPRLMYIAFLWKKSSILSITAGTVVYMALVHMI